MEEPEGASPEPAADAKDSADDKGKSLTIESVVTLKNLDLKVMKGEFLCVIGDVGSGKSSLLNALIGDLLFVSPELILKHGGVDGMKKEFKEESEKQSFQNDLVDENCGNLGIPAPIRLDGDIAYV